MKKLLFSAVDMNVGGIETALLTLLNYLASEDYKITLVLETKQGIFLKDLDDRIHIVEYKPSTCKNVFIRRAINLLKRIAFIVKYKNKFDFSASFATYSQMASFTARTASKNNALWVHSDYMEIYNKDIYKIQEFFKPLKPEEFKNIILVSKSSYNSFNKVFPNLENKLIQIGNLIDYKKIEGLANQKIEFEKSDNYTFICVGRHSEAEKKLTRVIEAAEKLKQDGLNFEVLLVGSGKDTAMYNEMIKKKGLEDEIKLLGMQKNPYPYMKMADAILLTSDYEGYPVVFQEAFVLNKPIITTDVSDAKEEIQGKFGKVVAKDASKIYEAMKEFIQNGYEVKEKFSPEAYNEEVIKKIEQCIRRARITK